MSTTAEQFTNEAIRFLKTDRLITKLAEVRPPTGEWTEAEITEAVKRTGCMPFTLSDVRYKRRLLTDEGVQDDQKVLDFLCGAMLKRDADKRMDFYNTHVRDFYNHAERYKRGIRDTFQNLLFYRED